MSQSDGGRDERTLESTTTSSMSLSSSSSSSSSTTTTTTPQRNALLVVDVQNDFVSGSLACANAEKIVPVINTLLDASAAEAERPLFDVVVFTMDWHPADHCSFAATHGEKPFSKKLLDYGVQTLWPVHCVADSDGAALVPALQFDETRGHRRLRKGLDRNAEQYSAFEDVTGKRGELYTMLADAKITRTFCCGLAQDVCVKQTALSSVRERLATVVINDASAPTVADSDVLRSSCNELEENNVRLLSSTQVIELIKSERRQERSAAQQQ